MTTTKAGSQAVEILEVTYDAARLLAPDLPAVAFTIKASGRKRNSVTLGHFAPERYRSDGAPLHEVCITGDTIRRGAMSILVTVLHEAAHALAAERGIKDTSRQNRYHNSRFADLAGELTLTYDQPENYALVPERKRKRGEKGAIPLVRKLVPDTVLGYSNVGAGPETALRFAGALDVITKDFPFDLGQGRRTPTKVRRVTHGYIVPMTSDLDGSRMPMDLVQMAPSRYRAVQPYLCDHVYGESTADEDQVLHALFDHGVSIPGKSPSTYYRTYPDDLSGFVSELKGLTDD